MNPCNVYFRAFGYGKNRLYLRSIVVKGKEKLLQQSRKYTAQATAKSATVMLKDTL